MFSMVYSRYRSHPYGSNGSSRPARAQRLEPRARRLTTSTRPLGNRYLLHSPLHNDSAYMHSFESLANDPGSDNASYVNYSSVMRSIIGPADGYLMHRPIEPFRRCAV